MNVEKTAFFFLTSRPLPRADTATLFSLRNDEDCRGWTKHLDLRITGTGRSELAEARQGDQADSTD